MHPRNVLWILVIALTTGCFHWSRIDDVAQLEGASRVRLVSAEGTVVLEHPAPASVVAMAEAKHATVEVKKLNAWATALIVVGSVLAAVGTAGIVLAFAVSGGSG